MLQPKVSVVIVTKNRSTELKHCIGSLLAGSILPDELVIIDNNSCDSTQDIINNLSTTIHISYNLCSARGYPAIYNCGLKAARNDWVAFIDDDCVADVKWVATISETICDNQQVAAIMGWCGTYFDQNVYSQATVMFDNEWKRRSIDGTGLLDYEVLDNKNIVYNKRFLSQHNIAYDENRSVCCLGAAQDCDLGIQLQEAKGKAILNKNIFIWHKDPQNLSSFMKKYFFSWISYQSLSKKWNMSKRMALKQPAKSLNELVSEYAGQNSLNTYQKIVLWLLAKQVLFLNRAMPILHRFLYHE